MKKLLPLTVGLALAQLAQAETQYGVEYTVPFLDTPNSAAVYLKTDIGLPIYGKLSAGRVSAKFSDSLRDNSNGTSALVQVTSSLDSLESTVKALEAASGQTTNPTITASGKTVTQGELFALNDQFAKHMVDEFTGGGKDINDVTKASAKGHAQMVGLEIGSLYPIVNNVDLTYGVRFEKGKATGSGNMTEQLTGTKLVDSESISGSAKATSYAMVTGFSAQVLKHVDVVSSVAVFSRSEIKFNDLDITKVLKASETDKEKGKITINTFLSMHRIGIRYRL